MFARQLLPEPTPLVLPEEFPRHLVSRALAVCERLHVLRGQLLSASTNAAAAAEWTVDSRGPSALGFIAALTADDLASFASISDQLGFLLDRVLDGSWVYAGDPTMRPMRCCITEQVRQVLQREESASAAVDFERIAAILGKTDYHEMSVSDRLSLFEAMFACLRRQPPLRKPLLWIPGRLVWWLPSLPGCLLVCQQTRGSAPSLAAGSATERAGYCLPAKGWRWSCYNAPDEQLVEALLQNARLVDRPRLAEAVARAGLHRHRQQGLGEAPRPVPGTVKQYLLAKIKSRLMGWAEVLCLGSERDSGSSVPRLREELAASGALSELLWCLRYLEAHQLPRFFGGRFWIREADSCATLASLCHLMNLAMAGDPSLRDRLRHQRGVCRWCEAPTGCVSRLLFCHACCHHYHWRCAPEAAPAARGLWLCDRCRLSASSSRQDQAALHSAPEVQASDEVSVVVAGHRSTVATSADGPPPDLDAAEIDEPSSKRHRPGDKL